MKGQTLGPARNIFPSSRFPFIRLFSVAFRHPGSFISFLDPSRPSHRQSEKSFFAATQLPGCSYINDSGATHYSSTSLQYLTSLSAYAVKITLLTTPCL